MIYQVLARKWRPQKFIDIVGQKHVVKILINSLKLNKLHHAYLLSGMHGIGKTTIARLLAKCLNCKIGITNIPCNQCQNCIKIENNCFVDLLEIDAASRTKVENTREMLDNIQYLPICGRFKIYLIDEVHMLSRHSFNALLKTLEEPPIHVKFILATTDPQKLPATILSRCLQLYLKKLDVDEILYQLVNILKKETIPFDTYALKLISNAANGSMRDALSLTEQAIVLGNNQIIKENVLLMLDLTDNEQALAIVEAIIHANCNSIMSYIAQYSSNNLNWDNLLIEILSIIHILAMNQILPNQIDHPKDNVLSRLYQLSQCVSPSDLQLYYQIILIGRKELPYAPNHRMGVEMTLLRALVFHPAKNMDAPNFFDEKQTTNNESNELISKNHDSLFMHNTFYEKMLLSKNLSPEILGNKLNVYNNEINKNLISTNIKKEMVHDVPKNINQELKKIVPKDNCAISVSSLSNNLSELSNIDELLKARFTLLKNKEDKKKIN